MRQRTALFVALSALSGCATVVATAISPVTGTVDAVRLAVEHENAWDALWKVPGMILLSPLVAFVLGAEIDCDFVTKGKYDRSAGERIVRPWYYAPGH